MKTRINEKLRLVGILCIIAVIFLSGCFQEEPLSLEGYWTCNYKTYFFSYVNEDGIGPWDCSNDRIKGTYKYTGKRLIMGVNVYNPVKGVVSQTVLDGKAELKLNEKIKVREGSVSPGSVLTVTSRDEKWEFVCTVPQNRRSDMLYTQP